MSHWALKYIGTPWKLGATGPEAYDCWGFVCEVQRTHYGIDMPGIELANTAKESVELLQSHDEVGKWIKTELPSDGDCVLMGRSRIPVHIGVWVQANGTTGVLHCLQGAGVVFQSAVTLYASGWGRLQYMRRAMK